MKNSFCLMAAILLVGCLALVGNSAFACSGGSGGSSSGSDDGGDNNPYADEGKNSGMRSNGPAYVDIKTQSQVTRKWNNIKKMNEAQRHLNHFQNVEDFGDLRTAQTQWGIFFWYNPERIVLIPFVAFWQIPKHASRTAWGYTTGKLDTVEEVNKRSWIGRQVNHYLIQNIK